MTIQIKRGLAAGIPTLADGEPGWTTDGHQLYVGQGGTNYLINSAGGGAPTNADYLVKTANGSLSAERVVQDTASIVADWTAAGVVGFNVQFGTSGSVATVGNDSRLSDARTPTGAAGGDLSGTYPNPGVAKVGGVTVSAFILTLLDDASASLARGTLGLGTVATLASDTDTTLAANSNTNVATQAAVKGYVDNLVTGLNWKPAVRAATTAAGTLASSFENGDTVDGVVLATGNRILIKNQADQTENGIYVVAASGAPTRAADADTGAELVNATVFVSEGTANADTQWTCTNNAVVFGTTNIVFAQVSGAGTYTADGSTIILTGNSFAVGAITETNIHLADVTSDNVSITAHGFAPKLPNDASKFLDGTGAYSIPPGHATQIDKVSAAGTGTITIPSWATTFDAVVIASGASGGSGRVGAAASFRGGGGGGSAGGLSRGSFKVSDLAGATALYYVVGAGGAGAAATGTAAANGNAGNNGNNSSLQVTNAAGAMLLVATGGVAGAGGTNAGPSSGAASGGGMFPGGSGGFGGSAGATVGSIPIGGAPTGGGAGGSITSGNVVIGNGGVAQDYGPTTAGPLTNSNLGGNGSFGGSTVGTAGPGLSSASPVGPGAGSGGSGGSTTGATSGASAAGNDGLVWIRWYP